MRLTTWLRGLRARLLVTVLLVTGLSVGVAAWSSTVSASNALVSSAEQRLTDATAAQITSIVPQVDLPPGQDQLDLIQSSVGPDAMATFGGQSSVGGSIVDLVGDDLRQAVREDGRITTQRVRLDGASWLVIGAPVMTTAIDGTQSPSGLEVYRAIGLSGVEAETDALARGAIGAAALTLPVAALIALLAANSVLRPVRQLRNTARRLAAGDLSARSTPRGADELADLTVTVNEMAESVQRMHADARRFAADVSHELRTPLSTLTAVMEVLEGSMTQLDPDARESAELAVAETHRLVELVDDLLEVSRFDAGTATLRREEIDVEAAVRQTLSARGVLGDVTIDAPGSVRALVDRRRLDVIVANLVGNALRHGRPPIRLIIAATAQVLRIEVTDAGDGMPVDALPHVFERFFKADGARSRSAGSGLGLALAIENARLHGGTITATNDPDGGARFVVLLPQTLTQAPELP